MKRILAVHSAVLVPLAFVFWLAAYPETMRWMEGMSFFSTLPDFAVLQARLPSGAEEYAGAFLLQFYHSPLTGALLQTLFAWMVMASADVLAWRLLRRGDRAWTAFVPVAVFVALQCGYRDLTGSIVWCLASGAAALAAVCLTRRPELYEAGGRRVYVAVLPCALLLPGMAVSLSVREYRVRERIHRVERMAEEKRWSDILDTVTPEKSAEDPVRRRYALLALGEAGQLPERVFRYGITGADDFFFARSADVVGCNFNALLAESLGLDNEAVHQLFQLGSLAPLGYSFRSMRRITDAFIRQGNTVLAEKYMRILLHSTCHGSWVRSRVPKLLDAVSDPVEREEDAILTCATNDAPLLMDMACLFDARPDNRKCVDILLCGLLASRDLERFAVLFPVAVSRAYSPDKPLPRYYEEALLLLSRQHPSVLERYKVSSWRREEFSRFVAMMDAGRYDDARAAYPDSFWAYMYAGAH